MWEELTWGPVQNYFHYCYPTWLAPYGRALSCMAKVLCPLGDGVTPGVEIQKLTYYHSRRNAAFTAQSGATVDIYNYYGHLMRAQIIRDIKLATDKGPAKNLFRA